MKTLRLLVLGTFALALTACPPPDDQEEDTNDEPDVEIAEEETVNLSEIDDSGVSGEASLMALNGQTDVRIEVDADDDRSEAQVVAAIYRQECDTLEDHQNGHDDQNGPDGQDDDAAEGDDEAPRETGEQVHQLEAITLDQEGRGAASTTVQQRMEELMDGNHSVQLRIDDVAVACGDIGTGTGAGW